MKCNHCEYPFDIYTFAYRQIRRCPECRQRYEMKFPVGTSFLPILLAFIISILMTNKNHFSISIGASIFILIYYLLDIILKIGMIYTDHFEVKEYH